MQYFLAICGIVGLYVGLSNWDWATHTVVLHAPGMNITVFVILLALGTLVILRATIFD